LEQKTNNFKIIFTLLFASTMTIMASATIAPSLPQITENFKGVPHVKTLTQLILTIPGLFIAILSPLAGYIIDTYGRKKLLLFSLILYAVSGTTGLYLDDIYLLLAGRAVLGIAVAGIMSTVTTLIADYFSDEVRNKIIGYQGSFMAYGGVLYIFTGGILADMDWRYPFGIYVIAIFAFILGILFLYEPKIDRSKKRVKIVEDVKIDYRKIFLVYFIAGTGMALFYLIPTQIPYILKDYGYANSFTGLAIATSTFTGGTISIYYRRFKSRFSFQGIYAFTFLMLALGYFLISVSNSFGFFIFSLVICGLGSGLLMPNGSLWLISLAPLHKRGRIIGSGVCT
jgi:MFS family permease